MGKKAQGKKLSYCRNRFPGGCTSLALALARHRHPDDKSEMTGGIHVNNASHCESVKARRL